MKQHFCMAPAELDNLNNQQLRSRFLMDGLFAPDVCTVHYVQEDRLLIFGLMPVRETLTLRCPMFEREAELLSRRELGLVNVGGTAEVLVDGKAWTLNIRIACTSAWESVPLPCAALRTNPQRFTRSPARRTRPTRTVWWIMRAR